MIPPPSPNPPVPVNYGELLGGMRPVQPPVSQALLAALTRPPEPSSPYLAALKALCEPPETAYLNAFKPTYEPPQWLEALLGKRKPPF